MADAPGALEPTQNVGLDLSKPSALDGQSGYAVPGLGAHFGSLDRATTTSRLATPRVTVWVSERRTSLDSALALNLSSLDRTVGSTRTRQGRQGSEHPYAGINFDVGTTRQGSVGSLHNYEGINTELDMPLQRGDPKQQRKVPKTAEFYGFEE